MKRIILTLLALLPLVSFGQAYSEPGNSTAGSIVVFLIGIGICIAIFLVLRQLFLWYWKVEVIIKKQDEQTQLLRSIYNSLEENNRLTQSQIEVVIGKDTNTL
ncbi:hypothetical protein WG904_03355 [Pedobacter sp. Du54]|uniref:hypothetical protein n=1 Tax=Pedobacter anseongensis TaxID=3133439 RepID=UPI0030982B76